MQRVGCPLARSWHEPPLPLPLPGSPVQPEAVRGEEQVL